MPVAVTRTPVTPAPPSKIVAGAGPDASYNGNVVAFRAVKAFEVDRPSLEVCTRRLDGVSASFAHLYAADARELAAALYEWADAVDPS